MPVTRCVIDMGPALTRVREHLSMLREYQIQTRELADDALEVWQQLFARDDATALEYFTSEVRPFVEMKLSELCLNIPQTPDYLAHPYDAMEEIVFATLETLESMCRGLHPYLNKLTHNLNDGVVEGLSVQRMLGTSAVINIRYHT